MNPASKDIANFLDEETSLGLTLQTDLFYGRMPDAKDVELCVAVLDNPSDPPPLTLKKSESDYFLCSVSVQVRAIVYEEGWALAQSILSFLHGMSDTDSIDATANYRLIQAMNDVQPLDWDNNERVTFFINFDIQRKPI